MPIFDPKRIDLSHHLEAHKKGDLKIVFDIQFPDVMREEDKIKLTEILCWIRLIVIIYNLYLFFNNLIPVNVE